MKDPKKPDRKTDDRAAEHANIRDLFKGIEDLDQSAAEGEDEEVLELDEVVDDGEEGLKDLPDLENDLTDLADLSDLDEAETALEEPELEESLFDEEVTVELAPAGKGLERLREPLEETAEDDETVPKEDVGEPLEDMLGPDLKDLLEPEAASAQSQERESLDDLGVEAETALDDLGESEPEPKPLETEVWETDKDLEALLKTAEAAVEAEPGPALEPELQGEPGPEERAWEEAETVFTEPVPKEPELSPLEPVRIDAEALEPMAKAPGYEPAMPDSGDVAIVGAAAVGAATAARPMTLTESAEEAMMEERPAMFQPIVEALEKRLQARVQAMVQKAVAEQLPGIVRRVLQEEIERLSKSLD